MRTIDKNNQFWKRVLFTAVPLLLLLICFSMWMLHDAPDNVLSLATAVALTFLFALCGIRFIPQWMDAWSTRPWQPERMMEGKRSGRAVALHPFFGIVLALILFRILLFAAAYLVVLARDGYTGGIFDNLDIWNMLGSDSRHYLNIAENWYVQSGDDRLLIVFMPFYPLMVRLFHYVFQNYLVSGLFVSNVCCVFAGWMFYELALLDMPKKDALRSLKFLCLLPASFLLSAPLSDSLFLLLTVSCVYFVRKDRYLPAGIMGFFAAFTRAPGILVLAPCLFELVGKIIRERREHFDEANWRLSCIGKACSLLLIPAGLLLYCYINYSVTGNATMFLVYQKEHWHQQLGWFFGTAATQMRSALSTFADNREMVWGLWVPNLVYLFASLSIVTAAQKKLRASSVAYFILYYLVCMGATWLLSGPRYLTVCYPLAMALGALTEKRWANWLATALCICGLVYYLFAYVNQWYVY